VGAIVIVGTEVIIGLGADGNAVVSAVGTKVKVGVDEMGKLDVGVLDEGGWLGTGVDGPDEIDVGAIVYEGD